MSLATIAQAHRSVLRWQTRMLVLWACVAGLATSALLLHRYAVHSMAVRYAASAAAMYLGGFLAGGYCCLRWWAAKPPTDAHFPTAAPDDDVGSYQEAAVAQRDYWFDITRWWSRGSDDDDDDDGRKFTLLERFLGWVLKLLIGLLLSVVATLAGLLLVYLPLVLAEALAGLLAVVVLRFVVSAQAMPQYGATPELSAYWQFVVSKTGLAAVACVAVAGAAGYWLEVNNPAATDLVDVVLPRILAYLPSSFPSDVPAFLASYLPSILH